MSAPRFAPCRFCGEHFRPSGIKNHETHCDQNPNPGVPVGKQQELGILDSSEESEEHDGGTHRDQTETPAVGNSLPPREETPDPDKSNSKAQVTSCPSCGSNDTMPSHQAREAFETHLDEIPSGLRVTMDATDLYCNDCWSVWGGELDEPHSIVGGMAS